MVPNGWSSTKFGNLFSVKSGFGFKLAEYSKTGIPLIKIDNVSYGYVKWDNISYLPESYTESYSDIVLKENDILLALNRPITQGKLKLVKLTANDVPSILYQRVGRIDFNSDGLDKDFYYYYLNSAIFEFVSRKSIGSDQPFISLTELKKLKIAKPPLPEQQKIAKILTTWDKAIDTTERLIDNSKRQKKALMQQLLTGKKRLLNDNGKPFDGEWKEVKLGDLKLDISDGNYSAKYPKQADFLDTGIPFLRANNLDKGTISDNDMRFISPKQHSEITKGHLKKGDILLSTRGELGNVALVPDRHIGSNINAQLVRINTKDKLNGKFLFQLFDYLRVTGKFESLSTGTALKQLPVGKLKQLEFKLPLLFEEQQKIASVLTNADKEIDLLEQQLADLQQEKKALMQQLLTGKKRVRIDEIV